MISTVLFAIAAQKSTEFKGVVFDMPAKWVSTSIQDAMIIKPNDLKGNEVVSVVFSKANPIEKSARQDFVNYIGGVESKLKVKSKGKISSWRRESLSVLKMRETIDGGKRGTFTSLYEMVSNGKTGVCASAIFSGEALPARYQKTMDALLLSIRPKGSPKPKSEKALPLYKRFDQQFVKGLRRLPRKFGPAHSAI